MAKLRVFTIALTIVFSTVALAGPGPGSGSKGRKWENTERSEIDFQYPLVIGTEDLYYHKFERKQLASLFKKEENVTVKNPEFNGRKITYFGVEMNYFLKKTLSIKVHEQPPISRPDDELMIIIRAADGYMPVIPVRYFAENKALLAVRDENSDPLHFRSHDSKWTMLEKGIAKSPGPYYLVWDTDKYFLLGTWPYQIRGIFVTRKGQVQKTLDYIDESARTGVFKFKLRDAYIKNFN